MGKDKKELSKKTQEAVKIKKEDGKWKRFEASAFKSILEKVHLQGVIDECLLEIKKGVGSIQAIDITNSIFVSCEQTIDMDDARLGLSKLSLICSFLNSGGEFLFLVEEGSEDRWAIFKKRGGGEIKSLLYEVDKIATIVSEDVEKDKILKDTPCKFVLTKEKCEELQYYMGLVGNDSVVFECVKGIVHARSVESAYQQFNLRLTSGDTKERVKTEIYTQFLTPVLKILQFAEDSSPVEIYIGNGQPLVVSQSNSLWMLSPLVGQSQEGDGSEPNTVE